MAGYCDQANGPDRGCQQCAAKQKSARAQRFNVDGPLQTESTSITLSITFESVTVVGQPSSDKAHAHGVVLAVPAGKRFIQNCDGSLLGFDLLILNPFLA